MRGGFLNGKVLKTRNQISYLKFIDILYSYFYWHLNDIKLIIYPIIVMSKPCLLFIGVNKAERTDR